ncbi:hypothetical protein RUM43_011303 [Polyplax serrata]|uniref:Uncharacterized protein n=1 Tax=Polyplax serrata TaxID=468196 RepID=A0AAN8S065_POLSC
MTRIRIRSEPRPSTSEAVVRRFDLKKSRSTGTNYTAVPEILFLRFNELLKVQVKNLWSLSICSPVDAVYIEQIENRRVP